MPRPRLQGEDIATRLDDIARLLAITLRRDRSLQDVIEEFNEAGISQSRIADLLDTSPQYVSVALARAKTRTKRKPRNDT